MDVGVMARDFLLHAIEHLAMRGCDNDTLDAIRVLLHASFTGMSGEQVLIIVDRLDEMARSLRAIAEELSKHAPAQEVPAEIMEIVRASSVIEGVRVWRNRTGMGIIEAKRAIDRVMADEV